MKRLTRWALIILTGWLLKLVLWLHEDGQENVFLVDKAGWNIDQFRKALIAAREKTALKKRCARLSQRA